MLALLLLAMAGLNADKSAAAKRALAIVRTRVRICFITTRSPCFAPPVLRLAATQPIHAETWNGTIM